jgi:hypothetical protein
MQRRIDLALLLDDELRAMLQRYKMVEFYLREIGAVDQGDYTWRQNVEEIEAELKLRESGEDVPPF